MKKIIIALLIAFMLTVSFVSPVLADQPVEPGLFGKAVSNEAQNSDEGFSNAIQDGQEEAEYLGIAMGQLIKSALDFCGVPPAHTP